MSEPDLDSVYDQIAAASQAALERLGKVNVLVAGLAGVGKSTLINAVFGRYLAKTGIGPSQTQKIEAHESPDSPLRIYDTRGFEIGNSVGTVGAVRQCVESLRASADVNNQIHIAWLCILEQSHRIEPVHQNLLKTLRSLSIPAIVVITQALGEKEMEEKVHELAIPNSGVQPVLAEPKRLAGIEFPKSGVNQLVHATIHLLPEAQKAAFIAAQMADWELKRKEAVKAINSHTLLAGGSALVPIPGGHSVALIALQVKLIAQINVSIGLSLSSAKAKDLVKTLSGILILKAGGQAAFGLGLSEAMRFFPGIGWIGAAAIGGPIGAAATKALGHLYLDSVTPYARDEKPLASGDELAKQMEKTYDAQKSYYDKLANTPTEPNVE